MILIDKIKYLGTEMSQPPTAKYNPTLQGKPHPDFEKVLNPPGFKKFKNVSTPP